MTPNRADQLARRALGILVSVCVAATAVWAGGTQWELGGTGDDVRSNARQALVAGTPVATPARLTVSDNAAQASSGMAGTLVHGIAADGVAARISTDSFGAAGSLVFRRRNGTAAGTPTPLAAGVSVGSISAVGHDGTSYSSAGGATLNFLSSEAWTSSAKGTYMTFSTTANGATSQTERMRIDDAGQVGIANTTPYAPLSIRGTWANASYPRAVDIVPTQTFDAATQYGIMMQPQVNPTSLTTYYGFLSAPSITGSALTIGAVYGGYARVDTGASFSGTITTAAGLYVDDSTKAAGTITNQYGLLVAGLADGTNNYGIGSIVTAAANRWNLYITGTANNYITGPVLIGGTPGPTPAAQLEVSGTVRVSTLGTTADKCVCVKSGGDLGTCTCASCTCG